MQFWALVKAWLLGLFFAKRARSLDLSAVLSSARAGKIAFLVRGNDVLLRISSRKKALWKVLIGR